MKSQLLSFTIAAALSPLSLPAQTTPAQRTIRENRVTTGKTDNAQGRDTAASGQAMDSVLSSTENLNTIRDGFLRRLSGDGCSPDVAARVAELRALLHDGEVRHGGAALQSVSASERSRAELESAMFVLASTWYTKRTADTPGNARKPAMDSEGERTRLLESVLAPNESGAAQSADTAQMRAELDRLLAGCRSGKE